MEELLYKKFVLVKDDFYKDPIKVQDAALAANYYEPRYYTGFRSREIYHEKGVKEKLEKIIGIKIIRWDTVPYDENGVFYYGYSRGNRKEIPGVHSDFPYNDITVVIYLTPNLPFDCGTSLWMHKKTKLCNPPTFADVRKLKMKVSDIRNLLERDSKNPGKWKEVDRVGYRFNRMVAYPSGVLHSATNHFGSSPKDGRYYQTFRIGVDWNSFKMSRA